MSSDRLNLTNKTSVTISVALLVFLGGFFYTLGSRVSEVEAKVKTSEEKINELSPKIDTLNENLQDTSINVAELTVLLNEVSKKLEAK